MEQLPGRHRRMNFRSERPCVPIPACIPREHWGLFYAGVQRGMAYAGSEEAKNER
jgi:hypothetical protein